MSDKEYQYEVGEDVYVKTKIKKNDISIGRTESGYGHYIVGSGSYGGRFHSNYILPVSALQEVPEFTQGDKVNVKSKWDNKWHDDIRIYLFSSNGMHYVLNTNDVEDLNDANTPVRAVQFKFCRKLPKKADKYELTLTKNGEHVNLDILSDSSILALKNGRKEG